MTTARSVQRHMAVRLDLACALVATLLANVFLLTTARASVPVQSVQPYNQNFDSLMSAGSAAWQNDVTLKGWYAAAGNTDITTLAAYNLDAPPTPANDIYSFGASAGSTDRALGLIGGFNNGKTPKRFGVVIKNTSGVRIKTLTVAYTGEQWLDANTNITTTERLQFKYKKAASLGAADIRTSIGFTNYPALNFNSPQNAGQGSINGNDPANSRAIVAVINLSPDLGPGQELMLAWEKDNVSGVMDDGLAIDDLSIKAGFGVVPPRAMCPPTVTAFQGSTTTAQLSAFDPNGTVTQADIVSTPVAGISLTNQIPAPVEGDTYTAALQIDGTQAVGTYQVAVRFTSQEANESTQCMITVNVRSTTDLAVSKDGPANYRPGEQLTYVITVNPGQSSATNLVLTDTLPADVTYVSDNSGVTPTQTGQTLVYNLGTLATQKTISLIAAASATASDPLTNTVTVSTSSQDTDLTNNTATTTAALRVAKPDFTGSSKTVSATTVQVGQVFTYTLAVENNGEADGTFALTDTLAPNLAVVTTSPGLTQNGTTLTATGPISAGDQLVYTFSVKANTAGTVNNSAKLSGDGAVQTLTAPAVTVLAQGVPANINGTKTLNKTQAEPGDDVTYTITVANSGQLQGSFTLTDTLDANLTLISAAGMNMNGPTLSVAGTLNDGESKSYVIVARVGPNVAKGTIIRNSATLIGAGQTRTLTAPALTVGQGGRMLYLPLIKK